jgi:CO/xanthine dehydrogenase Mo-binding subunit
VAAVDRYTAEDAAALIDVEYDPARPHRPHEAMKADAPKIHETCPATSCSRRPCPFGDVDGDFARAHG